MAKEFQFEIQEIIKCIKESPTNNWGKFIAKISYNGKPAKIDIRNMNLETKRIAGGIVLEPEEIDIVVDTFAEMGYGTTSLLEAEVKKRNSRYNVDAFMEEAKPEEYLN